jgi:hypothetical protein
MSRRAVRTAVALGALASVTLAAAPARAFHSGSGVGLPQPTLLRLTGFVRRGPEGAKTLGPITLGIGHTVLRFDLTAVQTLNGPLTEGRAALQQYDLYHPNLLLVGAPRLLREIRTAPPQTKLTVFGYVHAGAWRLLVVAVRRA